MTERGLIYGIDFSGDRRSAGKNIWLSEGTVERESLLIKDCFQVKNLPASGSNLQWEGDVWKVGRP